MIPPRARLTLSELLLQPDIVEQLRERFKHIQESLATSIQEASALTDLSQAQLRYAEARGMLAPHRAAPATEMGAVHGPPHTPPDARPTRPALSSQLNQVRGQRRYTADNLLRAHFIAFLLEHGYTLTEIDTFMANNLSVISELLQTRTMRLMPILESADALLFNRFFLPRVLYHALSLIFEREAVSDAGIIIPVRANVAELDQMEPPLIEAADDLAHIGQILVVWCVRGGTVATFLTSGNPFQREQRVRLKSLRLLQNALLPDAAACPAAYIACGPQAAPELEQADRTYKQRLERGRQPASGSRRIVDPRAVAARLIAQAQRLVCQQLADNPQAEAFGGDALLFTAPELINPALGDALLNRLADTLIELGGKAKENKENKENPAASRWRFACILTPRKPYSPFNQQELVVRAQSRESPHRIGVTSTSSRYNGGLTFHAFSSGRVAYRKEVKPLDPAVSYTDIESPIGSAIAAPAVEGHGIGHSQPPAVIYITSQDERAFTDDDFLLIRVMGRLVGEIVQAYNSRGHQPGTLTDTLDNPEIVDPYFAQFLSESDFTLKVNEILTAIAPKQEPAQAKESAATERPTQDADTAYGNLRTLTIVGLDVNDYSAIERRQGDRVARMLTREIGSRAQQRMDNTFSHGAQTAWLYRAWGDRFYMLILDEHAALARAHVERIRSDISGVYRLDDDTMVSVGSASGQPDGIAVSMRLAGMTFSRKDLLAQVKTADEDIADCVAGLTRLLDDGLKQANETPDREHCSLWWNVHGKRFEQADPRPHGASPATGPVAVLGAPPTESLMEEIAELNGVETTC